MYLLGQLTGTVQEPVFMASPSQYLPPYLGSGESHVRLCDSLPTPHVTVQGVDSDQGPQFPLTKEDIFPKSKCRNSRIQPL